MKYLRSSLVWPALVLAAACFSSHARAASVGPTGYTNDFSVQPPATDWSFFSIAGAAADVTTAAGLDAAVQTVAASSITSQTLADAGNPPALNASATWSSTGFYLQTRPTSIRAQLLMCTLVNNLGNDAGSVTISYDYANAQAATAEEVEGHRAFYSLTGAANSWTFIPEFATATSGRLTATLNIAWPNGGSLYVLWADDNGSPSPDEVNQIDNFSATAVSAVQTPATITTQPHSTNVLESQSATFSVVAAGSPAPTYQWYVNDGGDPVPIDEATSSSYTVSNVTPSQNGFQFYVTVSNTASNVNYNVDSDVAILTVTPDSTAPTIVQAFSPLSTRVQVVFSEPVTLASATTLANYSITNSGGTLTISSAVLSANLTNVVLTTSPQVLGTNYTLTVNGIRDRSAAGNLIAANSQFTFLTVAYANTDIGSPPVAGTFTGLANNGYDVRGSGSDIGGTNSDQFTFLDQPRSGDFDVKVRLAGLNLTDAWAKAGLMARADLTTNAPYAATFATPGISGCFFQYRAAVGSNGVNVGGFPVSPPNTWLRLKRVANTFTGLASFDGVNWAVLGSTSLVMTDPVYVGMAVTSRTNVTTLAQFREIANADPNASLGTVVYGGEPLAACTRKTGLVISEIMYKPAPRADGKNLEFFELYNSNPYSEDISGYQIAGAISYTFAPGTVMAGGSFLVLAKHAADVRAAYGLTGGVLEYGITNITSVTNVAFGETNVFSVTNVTNSLVSSATLQLLNNVGAVYLQIPYSSVNPWPVAADGTGHSLVLNRPSYGEGFPQAWGVSDVVGGSPGTFDPIPAGPLRSVMINEIAAHEDAGSGLDDYIELYNHSSLSNDISGCIIADKPTNDYATNTTYTTNGAVITTNVVVTQDGWYAIPANTILPPHGFLALSGAQLGFGLSSGGETIYFRTADGLHMLDAVQFEAQGNAQPNGRFPDGASEWYPMTARTPGTNNSGVLMNDIVINEIMYDPLSGDNNAEYVELYNKGTNKVDLSKWKFTQGISFTFPKGTTIDSNAYLVVARSMATLFSVYNNTNYPVTLTTNNTIGDFTGSLSHKGARLALAMPVPVIKTNNSGGLVTNSLDVVVDELTYGTGGRWGEWSAGGGSSLELKDPRGNHRLAYNWADSDETAKAPWTIIDVTSTMEFAAQDSTAFPINYMEIMAQGVGEWLVDDLFISCSSVGPGNLLTDANSNLESGMGGWLHRGAQLHSSLETSGGYPGVGQQCLHIRANDRGDSLANRSLCPLTATVTTPALFDHTTTMRLAAKVRWLKGWNEILLRAHGNPAEAPGELTVPGYLGTPGMRNSKAVTNAPPAIYQVSHAPILPAANQAAVVSARISDPDGPISPVLKYRVEPAAAYTSVNMVDDGTGGDAVAGDGIYSATIPAQAGGTSVAFLVQATDSLGATSIFPSDLAENGFVRECLVRFGEEIPSGSFGVYRLWLTQNSVNNWNNRLRLSNEDIDGTFVYGSYRAIYNMGSHYAGSPYHQGFSSPVNNACHYRINMPADDLFLGTTSFNKIHAPGNGPFGDQTTLREQVCYWMARQLGLPWNYRRYVVFYTNGQRQHTSTAGNLPVNGIMEDTQVPDGDMIKEFWPNDTNGQLYKLQPWFEAPDGATSSVADNNESWCDMIAWTNGVGALKLARYRHNWLTRSAPGSVNDYTNVFKFISAVTATNSPTYEKDITAQIDMEEYTRIWAIEHASGNWDSVGYRNEQNMYTYKPTQGKWTLMIWDWNIVLNNGGSTDGSDTASDNSNGGNLMYFNVQTDRPTCPYPDSPLGQIYATPSFLRSYLRCFKEIANGPMNNANVDPIIDGRLNALLANNVVPFSPAIVKTWIGAMHTSILNTLTNQQVMASSLVFGITSTTNSSTSNATFTITGTAPLEIKDVFVTVNGVPWYPTTWTSKTTWSGTFVLNQNATNQFAIQGFDRKTNALTAVFPVSVTYTGTVVSAVGALVINEIMYNPLTNNAAYVELYNNSDAPFDVSGWRLDGIGYTFPLGTTIAPRSYPVLAKDKAAVAATYGIKTTAILGEYPGNLAVNGETLTLVKPGVTSAGDLVITKVRYDNHLPWPVGADGTGVALQLIDPSDDNARVSNWSDSLSWKFYSVTGVVGSATSLVIYNKDRSEAWIDDLSLVPTNASFGGVSVLTNGGFEAPLSGTWNVPASMSASGNSAAYAHSGSYSLHIVNTDQGTINNAITQNLRPNLGRSVLSFWYRVNPLSVTNLVVQVVPLGLSGLTLTAIPPRNGSTPNASNSTFAPFPAYPLVWLNELQATNATGTNVDNNGDRDPWVELYNTSSNVVSLTNFYLANNYTNLAQWAFPDGAAINPGQFIIIWADGQPEQSTANVWHTSFRINPSTGSVALSRLLTNGVQLVDYLNYSGLGPDQAYGDYPDGQLFDRQTLIPTPGATNTPQPVHVLINEWVASNSSGDGGYPNPVGGKFDDWFELYNADLVHSADISGFYLTDSAANKTQWHIPNGAVIPPGGYMLVWADNGNSIGGNGDLHANFNLAKGGEAIGLYDVVGTNILQIDYVSFPAQSTDVSQGRYPDGASDIFFLGTPTPRAPNAMPGNRPPVVDSLPDQTVMVGNSISFPITATDPDAGQTLTYSLFPGHAAGATIDLNTGLFEWTPTAGQVGSSNQFIVNVTDNGTPSLSGSNLFKVFVLNDPPVLAAIADVTINLGQTVSFTASGSDPDAGQTLTYSLLAGFPTGASINGSSGLFQWTPSGAQAPSSNYITVRVTDNGVPALTDSKSFGVTVLDTTPPVVTCPGNVTAVCATAGATVVSFSGATAVDSSAGALPATCSPASGSSFPLGTTVVHCSATDPSGNTGGCNFNVTVSSHAATLTRLSPATAPAGSAGFTLTVIGTDLGCGPTVLWNGSNRVTTIDSLSTTQVFATILDSDLISTNDILTIPVTVVNSQSQTSNPVLFTLVSTNVGAAQSQSAGSGQTATVSSPSASAPLTNGQSAVTATVTNGGGSAPISLTAVNYNQNPTTSGTINVGGGYVDLKVTGADAGDSAGASFYYPTNITGTDEANLILLYYTGSAWNLVLSSGGAAPAKSTTDNLDGTTSGGRFKVVFNNTSTPKITELTGTPFTVTVPDNTPPVITCPANLTVDAGAGQCPVVVTFTVTATDNAGTASVVCNPASGSLFNLGTIPVNCTATDGSGNTAPCGFTVTVRDIVVPRMSILRQGADLLVRWPQSCTIYTLQKSSNLKDWVAPGVTANAVGTNYEATIHPPTGTWFYRLSP